MNIQHIHISKVQCSRIIFFSPEKINVILSIPLFKIYWRLPSSRKYWVYIVSWVPTEAIRREHPAETFPPLSQRNVHVSWNWAGINNSKRKGNLKVSDIWNWHVSFTMETWSYVKRVVERGNVPLDRDFSEFHCADIPRERKGENNVYFHLTSPNEGWILPVEVCSSSFHEALSSPRSKSTQDHVIHLVYELDKLLWNIIL